MKPWPAVVLALALAWPAAAEAGPEVAAQVDLSGGGGLDWTFGYGGFGLLSSPMGVSALFHVGGPLRLGPRGGARLGAVHEGYLLSADVGPRLLVEPRVGAELAVDGTAVASVHVRLEGVVALWPTWESRGVEPGGCAAFAVSVGPPDLPVRFLVTPVDACVTGPGRLRVAAHAGIVFRGRSTWAQ